MMSPSESFADIKGDRFRFHFQALFRFPEEFRDALRPISRDTQSADFGGSPIEKFSAAIVATVWQPPEQMSAEAFLY